MRAAVAPPLLLPLTHMPGHAYFLSHACYAMMPRLARYAEFELSPAAD